MADSAAGAVVATARAAWLLMTLLIIYGSLYPLHFAAPSDSAWPAFFTSLQARSGAGDVVGNIVLFVPYGLFATIGLRQRYGARGGIVGVLITAVLLAVALQIAQIYVPRRVPALIDVVWNLVGTCIGIALAPLLMSVAERRTPGALPVPLLLLALWLISEFVPLVPTLDMDSIKNSLKPLLVQPYWRLSSCLSAAASVLAALWLLARLVPASAVRWSRIGALLAVLAVGKILILTQIISLADVCGWMLGSSIWMFTARMRPPAQVRIVGTVVFATFTLAALEPFSLRAAPLVFGWFPFADVLSGSMVHNLGALAPRIFVYTLLLYMVRPAYLPRAALLLGVWVFLLELAQCWLNGRVATISEPLWVALAAWLLHKNATYAGRVAVTRVSPAAPSSSDR